MDEQIERLVVSVRADTASFARDVAAMRSELDGPLAAGVGRAGRLIESSFGRAIASGRLGFDELKRVAVAALAQIADASMRAIFAPGTSSNGSGGILSAALTGLLGAPGRGHGGPISAGRPFLVGERGPELFLPSVGGRVEPIRAGTRDVRVAISVHTPRPDDPAVMRQSSRQLARAVRAALRDK